MYTHYETVDLPCGKCVGCRLEYSRQWANRLMLEGKYHDKMYFVTLTYDNEHLPISYYPDPKTGEAFEAATLCVKDTQLFWKRLRKAFPEDNIRFYLAGEYGPRTFRPHYHAIIFGWNCPDMRPFGRNALGQQYFISDSLYKAWQKGNVSIAPANWETCAYVARYVTKKLTGEEGEFYKNFNIRPPFSTMSRKPGIGYKYYEDNKEQIFEFNKINISLRDKAKSFKPPRYYRNLYELEEPEVIGKLKETERLMAEETKKKKLLQSDKEWLDILKDEEEMKIRSMKKLKRVDF